MSGAGLCVVPSICTLPPVLAGQLAGWLAAGWLLAGGWLAAGWLAAGWLPIRFVAQNINNKIRATEKPQ